MAAKYVCTSPTDNFFTNSESAAMNHLKAHPDHHIIMIDRDPRHPDDMRIVETEKPE